MKLGLIVLLFLFAPCIQAQSYSDIASEKTGAYSYVAPPIIGLWKVNKVQVGTEEITPTAKWFSFKPTGEYESGNGWVQNGLGTFNYDSDKNELWQAIDGEADPMGAFAVEIEGDLMTWKRLEEGMEVMVSLSKTKAKPLAPWDLITGNWEEISYETLDLNSNIIAISDLDQGDRYYFGWDRRYRKYNLDGKRIETGIWHIEAHSNWLWTISDADNTKTGYALELKESEMNWTRDSNNEKLIIIFKRN